jgi:hypothetical protein
VKRSAQNKNARDDNRRFAAKARQSVFRVEHARHIQSDNNHHRDNVGADPFRDEQQNRRD